MDRLAWLRKMLENADLDLMREVLKVFAEELMGAETDAVCGADYGERSDERVNRRNGYQEREIDLTQEPWLYRTALTTEPRCEGPASVDTLSMRLSSRSGRLVENATALCAHLIV
jgi:hypothetical protein